MKQPVGQHAARSPARVGFVRRLLQITEGFTSVVFLFAFFLQLYALILRYFFNTGITQATEVGSFAVVVICFFGMVRGFGRKEHIRFSGLVTRLGGRTQRAFALVGDLLTLAVLCTIAYTGTLMTIRYAELYLRAVTMSWFPLWVLIVTVPVGAILSILGVVYYMAKHSRDAA